MQSFQNEHVSFTVQFLPDRRLALQGSVENAKRFVRMQIMAAHPIQQMTSYSGSGLPYACPNMAMENTPNVYDIPNQGDFSTVFSYPNSYYTNDGMQRIPPSLFFILIPMQGDPIFSQFTLPEESPLPLRSLTHRAGRSNGPAFYNAKDNVFAILPESAEKTMRAYKDYKLAYDTA